MMIHKALSYAVVLLLLAGGTASSWATELNSVFHGSHSRPLQALVLDVKNAHAELESLLLRELGCRQVRLCLLEAVPAQAQFEGEFWLRLRGSCTEQFTDFSFRLNPLDEMNKDTSVEFGYLKRGEISALYQSRNLKPLPPERYSDEIPAAPICY